MTDPRLQEAAQLRLAEAFDRAEALCHEVLAGNPAMPRPWPYWGYAPLNGDVTAGRDWLDRAEAADPDLAVLHLYRSIERAASGDVDRAIAAARRHGTCAGPVRCLGPAGDLSGQAGDFETAAEALPVPLRPSRIIRPSDQWPCALPRPVPKAAI
ncbi:hypothetical protein HXX25_06410 [Hyphobacterium sp. CCMP332]|uniref:tetratricopeptide repeat protein n=1 Tax=Hyphobacterium sp. CCMP332 TaxID=2749086 RepID=UPI0016509F89|nr:hypothetical protein [Hyphobacterium sp. CCMP332]QNL18999.1 hypothetical protein HXX25_06410 [Hyphobacterium sp. CCMP332]